MSRAQCASSETCLWYHSHVVRGKWQKLKIASGRALRVNGTVWLVLDFKQKVEPCQHDEPQSEWFGKRGMSVLGAWYTYRQDIDGVWVEKFGYVDLVIMDHIGQTTPDVMACIKVVLKVISNRLGSAYNSFIV